MSVPPVSTSRPPATISAASASAFARTCVWYSRKASRAAIRKHVAFAAITCSSGPPWSPGKTARSIAEACSSRQRTKPARGPASVLCVVEVTTSQSTIGFGCSPAATRPGEVRHVAPEQRADLVGDLAELPGLDRPRIGGAAAEDHLRPVLLREREHLVVVDEARLPRDAVVDDRVEPPREVDLEAVGQVAAVIEPEREHRVARLHQPEVHGHVRLRARVRLHVRVLGPEERLRPVDRELLDLVDDLAAAVVALAGVPLGVLVRRHRPDRLEHRGPGEVLRGDQLDLVALPLELGAEQLGDVGVDLARALPVRSWSSSASRRRAMATMLLDQRRRSSTRRPARRQAVEAAALDRDEPVEAAVGDRKVVPATAVDEIARPSRARSVSLPGRRTACRGPCRRRAGLRRRPLRAGRCPSARELVVARAAAKDVVADAAVDDVGAGAAVDDVGAAAAEDPVVATEAADHVAAARAAEHVSRLGPDDRAPHGPAGRVDGARRGRERRVRAGGRAGRAPRDEAVVPAHAR